MNIFIASSTEAKSYASSAQTLINEVDGLKATTWMDADFKLGGTIIESLETIKMKYDFSIFIFHPDGVTSTKEESKYSVRDNVLFEFGLFVGVLGIKKCFPIVPNNIDIKLLSDIHGVLYAKYKYTPDDENINSTLRASIDKISRNINEQNSTLEMIKNEFLVRGDYRDSIVDASVSTAMLDFELHKDWKEHISHAKKVKEELLYWERSTAGKWLKFEEYSASNLSHIVAVGESLKDQLNESIDFISLGPGSGKKDVAFITTLINKNKVNWYYPIDISSHLLFETLKNVTATFDDRYLKVKGLRANFNSLEKLKYVYQYTNNINVFTLFGNTLGNYNENRLLNVIKRAMLPNDLLVIEINKIIDFDHLSGKYENSNYRSFVLEPLKIFGLEVDESRLKFEKTDEFVSSVESANCVSASYYLSKYEKDFIKTKEEKIMITYSTHYDENKMTEFVENLGFEVISCRDDNDQLTYVLKIKRV